MKIKFTFGDEERRDFINNTQDVNFFYLSQTEKGIASDSMEKKPEKLADDDVINTLSENQRAIVAILDFTEHKLGISGKSSKYGQGVSNASLLDYESVSVYRREIWYDRFGNISGSESKWKQITPFIVGSRLIDYTVLNNRHYEYAIRLSQYTQSGKSEETLKGIYLNYKTNWLGWSITELHPTDDPKVYSASPVDVWRFKYNVSTGAQTQNTSKTQQETLARFPRFSHGLKNAISGNVECLLGRDVLNADYTNSTWRYRQGVDYANPSQWGWEEVRGNMKNLGGYVESLGRRSNSEAYQSASDIGFVGLTSNQSVDMLDKWKEVCYSGNPKLLKDEKGQGFIVQIFDTSNTTNTTWERRPETISFSWVQIADIKDINVTQIIQ